MESHNITLTSRRNSDFIAACTANEMWKRDRSVTARITADSLPAPRYYLEPDYAYRRLLAMLNHGRLPEKKLARQLWSEILAKVAARLSREPGCPLIDIITRVIAYEPASRYFISPENAVKIALGYRNGSTRKKAC